MKSLLTKEAVSILAPHVIDLVKGVLKPGKGKELQDTPMEQALQILGKDVQELQEVAAGHAAAIGEIAERVEARFVRLEKQLRLQRLVSLAAVAVAVIATVIALLK
jgi:hypothetical protein